MISPPFSFAMLDGHLAFTTAAAAVPEPSSAWLWLAGMLAIGHALRGRTKRVKSASK
jgi:hypothetical protein